MDRVAQRWLCACRRPPPDTHTRPKNTVRSIQRGRIQRQTTAVHTSYATLARRHAYLFTGMLNTTTPLYDQHRYRHRCCSRAHLVRIRPCYAICFAKLYTPTNTNTNSISSGGEKRKSRSLRRDGPPCTCSRSYSIQNAINILTIHPSATHN